jgi:hypothetical protein
MIVQCFDSCPMALSPVETSHSQDSRKHCPFIHLDRYLGGDWPSVYASSKSRVIVKFVHEPRGDKAELESLLRDERDAYHKLASARLTRWVVPHFYGEYDWYGGRAFVLSDEGSPLDIPGMEFPMTSLGFVERCDSLALLCGEFC